MNQESQIAFISLGTSANNVTIGCAKVIDEADKIYCFGSHGKSHCADIIGDITNLDKVEVIDIPMSKDRTQVMAVYESLASRIADEHGKGMKIAVATEGDTGLFATTHYVMDKLTERGIPCRQHAGVPAFIEAAAIAGLHLAKLNERLIVIPGTTTAEELAQLVNNGTNVVIMKLSMATDAVHKCICAHPEFQYHYFRNIGMESQEHISDTTILKDLDFPYFSLMIIATHTTKVA